jgi:hypothetical protein
MVLLAQWDLDEGPYQEPTTAVDSAGGGSGSHDGTYVWGSSIWIGYKSAGGLGPWCFESGNGRIDPFLNNADFLLYGAMTAMAWFMKPPDDTWDYFPIMCFQGATVGADYNSLFTMDFRGVTDQLSFRWESAEDVWQDPRMSSGNVNPIGWNHLVAVRYVASGQNLGVRFYLNGALVNVDDNAGAGYPPPTGGLLSTLFIAQYASLSNANRPRLAGIRVYDDEQSLAQIQAVYNAELPLIEAATAEGIIGKPFTRPIPGERVYSPAYMGRRTERFQAGFHR